MAETCHACLVAWSHRLILVALPFILACCATVAVSVADLAGSEVGLGSQQTWVQIITMVTGVLLALL